MSKKKVPELRFKGFNEDWEQRKLGDLGSFKNGMNFGKESMGHGYPFVNLQDVFGKNIVSANNLSYADCTEGQRKEYSLLKGDVLFVRSSVKPEGVGEASLIPHDFIECTYSGFIIRFRPDVEMSDNFKRFVFSTKYIRNQIMAKATSSANTNINQDSLTNIKMFLPSVDEQQKIGAFFKSLDDTIVLHQEKLEKLKQLKKAYLQMMFPQNGEKVPRLRFANFSSDWENREFISIVNRKSTSSSSNKLPKVEFEDIVAGEGRLNKDISHKFDDRRGIIFEPGNILYGKLRPYLKNWLLPDFEGIALGDFWVFETVNSDEKFDYYLIQADKYQKVANDTTGTKMPRSDWKKVSVTSFSIPSFEEQNRIGAFFKKIDDSIALHRNNLEDLKSLKKVYLKKLFV